MGDQSDDGIGRRQAEVRKQLGLTQSEMADRLGIPMRTLSDNERGVSTPGGRVLQTYARLGISVDWMITGEGRPFREETSVGAIDLAELHGSTRIAIAVFDPTDVLDTYIVDSEERHRRARISLAPEIVEEMVPVRDLGLPDACRLFAWHDSTQRELIFFDALRDVDETPGDHLVQFDGQMLVKRIQLVGRETAVVMTSDSRRSVESVVERRAINAKGRSVGRVRLG